MEVLGDHYTRRNPHVAPPEPRLQLILPHLQGQPDTVAIVRLSLQSGQLLRTLRAPGDFSFNVPESLLMRVGHCQP